MQQILQNLSNGETMVVDVPAPSVSSNRLIIQTRNTLISAGTEKMLVEFGQAGLIGKARAQPEKVKQVLAKIRTDGLMPTLDAVFSKLGEPLPLGYCNSGIVTEVGTSVKDFEVGDRVVSNGPHAEFVSVPQNLCAKIPENVSDSEASFTVLASIGLQGIRLIDPTLGETVVVYGLGLIGLVTVQLLRANGCKVIGIDINESRLQLATEFGAEVINGAHCPDIVAKVEGLTSMRGVDAVLITASSKNDAIISNAAQMCRKRGRVVLVGVVGLDLKRSDFYEKEISFQVSCSYGPGRYDSEYEQGGRDYPIGYVRWTEQRNFEAILSMLSSGTVSFQKLLTHHFEIRRAVEAYALIQSDSSALGVVLDFPAEADPSKSIHVVSASPSKPQPKIIAAVVGAGNFTRATLMPALAKLPIRMKYIAGRSATATIQHVAKKFSVENATTDLESVLSDSEINLVFITTNHDSHARLTCKALNSGKHVFVEKPLALSFDEIEAIVKAVKENPDRQLLVGFNRRFSPHIERCKELLRGRAAPIAVNIVVNAGEIPLDHWVHDEQIGGGRIIGEACHFIDLLVHLTDSRVRAVSAHRMGGSVGIRDDKMTLSFSMEDGSVANICYFANGSKTFPKESVTLFSDNRVLAIDNFRSTMGYGFSGFRKLKTMRQEKGHRQQFSNFANTIANGGKWLIPLDEMINVTLASFAAVRSARHERTIVLSEEFGER